MTLSDYKNLWSKFLGKPPIDQQFQLWMEMHNSNTIRHGILKAAQKNIVLGGTMSDDHKIRFASKVMNGSTQQRIDGQRTEK